MKSKVLLSIGSILFLIGIFLFSKQNKETGNEISFWELDIDKIEYIPPKIESDTTWKFFIESKQIISIKKSEYNKTPFFLVEGKDKKSNYNYLYEGGYNTKNSFSELSILLTRAVLKPESNVLDKLNISDSSPKVNLFKNEKILRTIIFGKENKQFVDRFILADGKILQVQSFIINKFKNHPNILRERRMIFDDEMEYEKIEFWDENIHIVKSGKEITQKIQESIQQCFYVEYFPDDPNSTGFIDSLSVEEIPKKKIIVSFRSGKKIIINLFHEVEISKLKYLFTVREIDSIFKESPTYINSLKLKDFVKGLNM